jgi:hypothetical protein
MLVSGATSHEYCMGSQTGNYFDAFVTLFLQASELLCQGEKFKTPLLKFSFMNRLYVCCICQLRLSCNMK